VLYPAPVGTDNVRYETGRELLVLVGEDTITYNDMLGKSFQVPILSRGTVTPPGDRRTAGCSDVQDRRGATATHEPERVLCVENLGILRDELTGIGRARALAFAHEGARIVVSGRRDDEGQKLATELRNLGAEAEFVRTDARHDDEVKNPVDKTIARFGRLDIAVNNAGTVGNPGPAADVTTEAYHAIFDTNVLGVLLSMKCEIRAMLRQGKGSIVNISSAYGKVGGPTASVYVGSKHAVEDITKSAVLELAGTGVRVNIVGPGPVEMRMFNHFAQTEENKANFLDSQIPNKRIGTPEEIANAIMFIGSDKVSYSIGASLAVAGGMIAD
jgi:NAD(P)-dependent dehydrogenase (short-subunit alcohol dehydrogenase family)